MKKSITIFSLIIISVFIACSNANAETVSFGDASRYWPGWDNGSGDDSQDSIGIPNFTEGQATITGNRLTNLTFERAVSPNTNWWVLSPGDLFIDTGADQRWDYVVDLSLSGWAAAGVNNIDAGHGDYKIYSIDLALDDINTNAGYLLSGTDRTGDWTGWYIRDGHPVAANIDILNGEEDGSAHFSGWNNGSTIEYTFDFNNLDLGSSGQFAIGWQPNCANDVVYETMRYHATPEPATMSLLGLGLAGLLRFRRKK